MDIDWSEFDGIPEHSLGCCCGTSFRGHAKVIYEGEHRGVYSRVPCPACGRSDQIKRISSDPEYQVINS